MIENRNTATTRSADGYIAPYFRLATHLGYCYGVASNTSMDWATRKNDIASDLREALHHIASAKDVSPYVSADTCTELQTLNDDIDRLQRGFDTEEETLAALITSSHNAAYAMAKLEYDLFGQAATAGTEI